MHGAPRGYYGKVTTHGDFVGRGLPPEFVQGWDRWLQEAIVASRAALGERWLACYLNSPVWRFALAPGVLGQAGWGGVMMPSVDRVGRHFPLVLAAAGAPPLLHWFKLHGAWFDQLEDLARGTLVAESQLTDLEQLPPPPVASGAGPAQRWRLPLAAAGGEAVAAAALAGHSLWWSEGGPQVEPSLVGCRGLPDPHAFAALLDGAWAARGWSEHPA